MSEMSILKVSWFDNFRQNRCNICTLQRVILLIGQQFYQNSFIFMEDNVIKLKIIDRFVNLCEQSLNLLARSHKILINHLLQIGSLLIFWVVVLCHYMPYLFNGSNIVQPLVLLVGADATLCIADCACTRFAGYAAS